MNFATALMLLWNALFQTYPAPGPRNAGTTTGSAAFVQACNGSAVSSAPACTFGSNITATDQLWVCVTHVGSGAPTWTGDGSSGSWTADPGGGTAITNIFWDTGDNYYVSCAYKLSAVGGGNTITATISGGGYYLIGGIEFSGTSGVDVSENGTAQNSFLTSSPMVSSSITPSNSHDIVLGFCTFATTSTLGVGTNVAWTLGNHIPPVGFTVPALNEYYLQIGAAPVAAQCTSSATGYYYWIHAIAFH